MDIRSATLVYFSPTRTTRRVLEGIAEALPVPATHLDLTPPSARTMPEDSLRGDLAIIGVPVYGGRIPVAAAARLRRLRAPGIPAILVVVYGNREFECALRELQDVVGEMGCLPVAGAAFVGEHTANYALRGEALPIAQGRPDAQDLTRARDFGRSVWERLCRLATADGVPLQLPGDPPPAEERRWAPDAPATLAELCCLCGRCAAACPVGAIHIETLVSTDPEACIMCLACVMHCPTGARDASETWIKAAGLRLSTRCQPRKEPQIYL